jgi:hypothetical protein
MDVRADVAEQLEMPHREIAVVDVPGSEADIHDRWPRLNLRLSGASNC